MEQPRHDNSPAEAPTIPGYRMLGLVGRGAYGQVWMAEETLTGVRRALKVLPKVAAGLPFDPARELAGIREYQQKSRDHPCLIQIYHVDETADYYYYAMEPADNAVADDADPAASDVAGTTGDAANDGGKSDDAAGLQGYRPLTLDTFIRRDAPIAPDRALDILAQVLRGLDHLHTSGLLHRDVKPSNVLVVDGTIKLADVGLVTTLDRDVTQIGTPGYMPPDATLDRTADLYAAGIILYELITGLHRSRFPELPVLKPRSRRERHDLRAAIHIANKAAHPDRRRRYATASQVLRDVTARRARDSRRRNRILAGAGVVCILLAAVWISRWNATHTTPEALPWHFVSSNVLASDKKVVELHYRDGSTTLVPFRSPVNNVVTVYFTSDGAPTVAIGTGDEGEEPGHLIAFDPTDPASATTKPLYDKALYEQPPWRHQGFSPPCSVTPVVPADLDGRPGQELVVAVRHHEGPTRWIIFNNEWTQLSEYWHYGHMTQAKDADVDGDGLPELICWGFANERPPQPAFAAITEDQHFAILILEPRRSEPGELPRRWSMNPWMNDRAQAPVAYGYITKKIDAWAGDVWQVEGPDQFKVRPEAPSPIEVELKVGLMLELDRRLNLVGVREDSSGSRWKGPIPDPADVWKRLWPPEDESAKDSVKDLPPSGQ